MMGQTHNVLVKPGGRDRNSGLPLGIRETITRLKSLLSLEPTVLQKAGTGPWLWAGWGKQTYLEGLV